jgi:hypothetical protein
MRRINQITTQQSDLVRSNFNNRQVAIEIRRRTRSNGNGTYVGYDAQSGLHSVQTPEGITRGTFISNSGIARGEQIVWTRSGSGSTFKTIPR